MAFSVHGAHRLEDHLSHLRPRDILAWLKAGFAIIEQDEPKRLPDSFPPLLINPERNALAQLGTALREIEAADLRGTARVRKAIRDHLIQPRAVRSGAPHHLKRFWQLLGSLACEPDLHADARRFIAHLGEARTRRKPPPAAVEPALGEIVEAMVLAVAATWPPTPAQSQFFRFLKRKPELWSSRFVTLAIDCEFRAARHLLSSEGAEKTAKLESWLDLRDDYQDDLSVEADPSTAAGRALLRSLARSLRLDPAEAADAQSADKLREELWKLSYRASVRRPDLEMRQSATFQPIPAY